MPQPAPPRRAATVILLRDREGTLEVLLARRNPEARFMGGAWVFPGGAVSREDGDSLRRTALRELREEVGIDLPGGLEALLPFSNWITPEPSPLRFDTWFFLAETPPGAEPQVDGREMVQAGWFAPAAALAGGLDLVFPTIKHLEQLSRFPSVASLFGHARGREIRPVQPIVVGTGEHARIALPDELDSMEGS